MNLISPERFKKLLNNIKSIPSVIVLGDVGIDKYTYGNVNRISPEAPVPVLEVTEELYKLGLAANVANNFISLGAKATICGVTGDDKNGSLFESLLSDFSIKSWGIIRDASRKTTYKERVLTNFQQICRVDYETSTAIEADLEEKLFKRIRELKDDHGSLIIEDYGKGVLTEKLTQRVIKEFTESNKIVAIDPSRSTPPKYYQGATLLKPNWKESVRIASELGYHGEKLEQITELLVDKLKLEKILITLGKDGMALLDTKTDGKLKRIPTVAMEVFDVSGAGDTAICMITAALLSGATLEEAAWMGNCASGLVVGKKGTATVTITELEKYYIRLQQKFEK